MTQLSLLISTSLRAPSRVRTRSISFFPQKSMFTPIAFLLQDVTRKIKYFSLIYSWIPYNKFRFRSPGLRGKHHTKIPKISTQPLNTLLPFTRDKVLSRIYVGELKINSVYYPLNQVPSCTPFYLSSDQNLDISGDVPWLIQEKILLNHWLSSESFQSNYLQSLLGDFLSIEVTSLCSEFLTISRTSGDTGIIMDRF